VGRSIRSPRDIGVVVSRFVDACSADDRVVAAFLTGSYARGEADEYSDLDLGVVTRHHAFDSFLADRESFVRRLGEPLFLEVFGGGRVVFFILADGTEGELFYGHEGALAEFDVGPFESLFDRTGILTGVEFPLEQPDPDDVRASLRFVVNVFWHDLSHLIAGLGRGDLWWAYGQLEALRRYCVNLVRIEHGAEAEEEAYEKLEKAIPVSELSALRATFCPMERQAMLRAARDVVGFFRDRAPRAAEAHGLEYPADLARLMSDRLDDLAAASG
jgi:predicted nucleotidyltransferase